MMIVVPSFATSQNRDESVFHGGHCPGRKKEFKQITFRLFQEPLTYQRALYHTYEQHC